MRGHMTEIRNLSRLCCSVTEFGVYDCTSTWALLAGEPIKLTSYDTVRRSEVDEVEATALSAGIHFKFVQANVIEGDARKVLPALGEFDRIIMPLPKQAETFLDVTLPALKKGGIIHYYTFAHDPDEAVKGLREAVGKLGRKPNIAAAVECGSYSPCRSRMCVDFTIA